MTNAITIEGLGYRLRPVTQADAAFIVAVRGRNTPFIGAIAPDVTAQEKWIAAYEERTDDYYFVVENRITGQPEGLIGFYDVADGRAEWGRWVLTDGSLAGAESVWLLFRAAFDTLGLDELYCRSATDNAKVVSFHDSIGLERRALLPGHFHIHGQTLDAVEHVLSREHYALIVLPKLQKLAALVAQRHLRTAIGQMTFHHIGVACSSIDKELATYQMLGYACEDARFEDPAQGIRGQFITAPGQPRLELLENLAGSTTLDRWLQSGCRMYHFGYRVAAFDATADVLTRLRAKMIAPPKPSVYFQSRIAFFVLPNLQMIEIIE